MKQICMLLFLMLFWQLGIGVGGSQMDAKTLIPLLNFSRSLIQDGEVKFLYYENDPTHPDEVGLVQRKMLTSLEAYLEDAHNAIDPKKYRERVLKRIEREKKYGAFRDSAEAFIFYEGNAVFRVDPDSIQHEEKFNIRLEMILPLEHYPSLALKRFMGNGGQYLYLQNLNQQLRTHFPNPMMTESLVGFMQKMVMERMQSFPHGAVVSTIHVPPSHFIDEKQAQMDLLQSTNGQVTVITHFPGEKVMAKVYVRFNKGLPEIFRQEYHYKSESPLADEEGYWLRSATDYSDFETIETLNISFPKVREEQEFRGVDGFMVRNSIYTIIEMDFNVGIPDSFFDWDEAELIYDDSGRKKIHGEFQKRTIVKPEKDPAN